MSNITYRLIYVLLLLICNINSSYTQSAYRAILLESESNQPIIDALIILDNNFDFTTSDSTGAFQFTTSENTKQLNLQISTLTCRHNITVDAHKNISDTIRILCAPFKLDEVVITYNDPKQIVLNAIERIPQNYMDSTFALNAFYRHYQNINGNYANLTEAQSTTLFRISRKRAALAADEAVAVQAIRRSDRYFLPEEFHGDDYKDMLYQNPIYHLFTSSLNPEKVEDCKYYISPLSNDTNWVIYYIAKNYSSENHGISGFYPNDFYGEADETGTYIINKKTLAFISIERKAMRNQKYDYPKYNNFLYPNNNYTGEFIDGYLLINFDQTNDKYYPKQIFHSYTNEFFASISYERAYRITDYFEWFGGKPTTFVSKETMQKFIDYRSIRESSAKYYPEQWILPIPDIKLIPPAELINALEKEESLDDQYLRNGK
ncbi:MAG: hypothetical protein IPI31_10050 [Bacteroidetes bacterium]|nr:hypothetical protein [Bacteroidota bacterium]